MREGGREGGRGRRKGEGGMNGERDRGREEEEETQNKIDGGSNVGTTHHARSLNQR